MTDSDLERARESADALTRADAAGPRPKDIRPLWHTLSADDTVSRLGSDPVRGLSNAETARRLAADGLNSLVEQQRVPPWRRFLEQFNDFMIYVLLAAVAISALQGDDVEAVAILAIVLLNGVLGFVQESRAEQALAALKQLAAPQALVVRDGVEETVQAAELVAGDIIVLGAGDSVPADARLLLAVAMRAEEATLTGESVPVHKSPEPVEDERAPLGDRRGLVFAGTHIAAGRGRAVVVATGMGTEVGKIAALLDQPEEKTPLQKELHSVGKRIAVLCLAVSAIVFSTGLLRGNAPAEMFLIAVSLAVAAIPEGLPAVVTVALALAVQRMAARNAIVRRLHAVETLGSTDTICTDKTGTLTVNEMTVTTVASADEAWPADLLGRESASSDSAPVLDWLRLVARHCNDARPSVDGYLGDPTEVALLRFAGETMGAQRLDEAPFDSDRKRMAVVARLDDGRLLALVKGAPDLIIDRCSHYVGSDGDTLPLGAGVRTRLASEVERLAATGRRTLAGAFRRVDDPWPDSPEALESDLVFVGLYALADPPRPEVPDAIALCRSAGIRVVMVTGDHQLTGVAVGEEIGIVGEAISGPELDGLSDKALDGRVESLDIYARVSPSHKLRIVEALRARGHVVAMTGDGVNDAPALKRADIGVAMGRIGTDVTREAADMVLADDNFATIVSAVREGRAVFDNIRKVILFLLSCNVSEVLIVFVSTLFLKLPALLPLQILWINLVTDGLPALALGVDPPASDLMDRRPRKRAEGVLVWRRQLQLVVQGALITGGGLAALLWELRSGAPIESARTVLFSTMVVTQLLHAFSFRSERSTVFAAASLKNGVLNASFLASMALHLGVVYLSPLAPAGLARAFGVGPMALQDWMTVLVCSLVPTCLIDLLKRRLAPADS